MENMEMNQSNGHAVDNVGRLYCTTAAKDGEVKCDKGIRGRQ
jgi:hypothetical protein